MKKAQDADLAKKLLILDNKAQAEHNQKMLDQEENEKKKSPYNNFCQLNRDMINRLDWVVATNPSAYRVFLYMIECMGKNNALICSYVPIMESLGISQATVARSIKFLQENGFIQVVKTGTSNVYTVNANIVWTSNGDAYQHAAFKASVVISKTEQEEKKQAVRPRAKAKSTKMAR